MRVKRVWVALVLVIWAGFASIVSAGEEGPKNAPAAESVVEPAAAPADQVEVLGPVIRFESETVDLGRVRSGQSAEYIYRFKNEGRATLEIFSVQPS